MKASALTDSDSPPARRGLPTPEPRAQGELARIVRQIQALRAEIENLRRTPGDAREVEAKELTLEQLRWRLARVARRTATAELNDAA
jgi:hypothetical protein